MAENIIENLARWLAFSIRLQDRFNKNPVMKGMVNRGDIYACYLGQNIGYEKSRLEARPCLVVSSDNINHKSGNIIVVPLSKNVKRGRGSAQNVLKYDWHYILYKSKYKLNFDSLVQCGDIRCISKVRLGRYIDHVDQFDMKNIGKRIKKALQT